MTQKLQYWQNLPRQVGIFVIDFGICCGVDKNQMSKFVQKMKSHKKKSHKSRAGAQRLTMNSRRRAVFPAFRSGHQMEVVSRPTTSQAGRRRLGATRPGWRGNPHSSRSGRRDSRTQVECRTRRQSSCMSKRTSQPWTGRSGQCAADPSGTGQPQHRTKT